MKRTFVRFVVGLLTLAGLGVWAFAGSLPWDAGEIVIAGLALVVVGLAAYL
jgi:hypothetical protein